MSPEEKETYRGDVGSYEGTVPLWLKIVFGALIVWAIIYFLTNWGGFGPAY
jgi:hypothetical protein